MDTAIDSQLLIQLIKDLGYPAAISLLLLYYIYRVTLPLVSTVTELKDMVAGIKSCITELKTLIKRHVESTR
jgi:hypothetical protein